MHNLPLSVVKFFLLLLSTNPPLILLYQQSFIYIIVPASKVIVMTKAYSFTFVITTRISHDNDLIQFLKDTELNLEKLCTTSLTCPLVHSKVITIHDVSKVLSPLLPFERVHNELMIFSSYLCIAYSV